MGVAVTLHAVLATWNECGSTDYKRRGEASSVEPMKGYNEWCGFTYRPTGEEAVVVMERTGCSAADAKRKNGLASEP